MLYYPKNGISFFLIIQINLIKKRFPYIFRVSEVSLLKFAQIVIRKTSGPEVFSANLKEKNTHAEVRFQ